MSSKKDDSNNSQEKPSIMSSYKHLSKKEVAHIDAAWKRVRTRQQENKPDARDTFELIYLGFLANIKDKKAVEADLKELKSLLDASAAKMMDIMAKSQNQPGTSGQEPSSKDETKE